MARIPLIRPFRAGKIGLQKAYRNFARNRALDKKINIKAMSDALLDRYIKLQQARSLRRTNKLAPWKIGGGIAAALGATGIASLALPNLLNTLKITNTVNNDPNAVADVIADAIERGVNSAAAPVKKQVVDPLMGLYGNIRQDVVNAVPYVLQKVQDIYRQGKQDAGQAYLRINQDAGSVYSQGRRDAKDAYLRVTRDGATIYNRGIQDALRVYDRTTGDVRDAYGKVTGDVSGAYDKANKDIDNRIKYGLRKVLDFMNRTRDLMQRGKTIFLILSQPYRQPTQYEYPQY